MKTECPTCGKDGFANEKGMKKHHYMVHGESIAFTEVDCHNCGETVRKRDCDIAGNVYCSTRCLSEKYSERTPSGEEHPDYKGGGWQNYGQNWERQREKAIERDYGRCRLCRAKPDSPHVHHRTPYDHFDHNGEANRVENLLTLCPSCHAAVENSDMTP
jgi:5-methylcytosine-specific restriction endonuclease McrA